MRAATPFVATLLIMNLAPIWVLGASAAISLVAAILMFQVPFPPRVSDMTLREHGFFRQTLAGMVEIVKNPSLSGAIAFMAAASFGIIVYGRMIILLAVELGLSADLSRMNYIALGLGGTLGSLALIYLTFNTRPMLNMAFGAVTGGVLVVGLGLSVGGSAAVSLTLFFVTIAAASALNSWIYIPYRSIIQTETSVEKIGRVAAIGESLFALAILAGIMLSGLLLDQFDMGAAFAVGGALMLIVGILGAATSSRQNK